MSEWTDELKAELRRRWTAGHSAGDIATRMEGNFSRNAIMGAVHRMGLPGRKTTSRHPTRTQWTHKPVDWAERRRVILDVQAHGGTCADAGRRLGINADTARKDAKNMGIPFKARSTAPAGQRATVSLPRLPRAPRAPNPVSHAPEPSLIAAYEAQRREDGAIPFIDAPSMGRCKMFLAGESGIHGLQCAARTGVTDSWCRLHNAVVSAPVPARQNIFGLRR